MKYIITILICFISLNNAFCQGSKTSKDNKIEIENLNSYKYYLSGLNINYLWSIDKAKDKLFDIFENSPRYYKDMAFDEFMEFVIKVQGAIDDEISSGSYDEDQLRSLSAIKDYPSEETVEYIKTLNENISQKSLELLKEINQYSFMLYVEDGPIFVVWGSFRYIRKNFSDFISINSREYYSMAIEDAPLVWGAGINIEIKELVKRIVRDEEFLNRKGLTPNITTILNCYIASCMSLLFCGLDLTPSFNYENQSLNEEFKKAYEYAIYNFPNSPRCQEIKSYYTILKKNNFERTQQVEDYLYNLGYCL